MEITKVEEIINSYITLLKFTRIESVRHGSISNDIRYKLFYFIDFDDYDDNKQPSLIITIPHNRDVIEVKIEKHIDKTNTLEEKFLYQYRGLCYGGYESHFRLCSIKFENLDKFQEFLFGYEQFFY